MISYLKYYNSADKSVCEKEAFNFLVTDLLSKNLTGEDKQFTITAHNMEEALKEKMLPSIFYLLMYAKPDKSDVIGKIKFYDVCPLIFCLGYNGKTVTGVNFNLIPNNLRASILDLIVDTNVPFYENVSTTNVNDIQYNEPLATLFVADPNGIASFVAYVKSKTNIDISSCIRTYNVENIKNVRMIEYDEWYHIPFLNFNDSVRGANLALLQSALVQNQR